jgi:hypothetical protein
MPPVDPPVPCETGLGSEAVLQLAAATRMKMRSRHVIMGHPSGAIVN